MSTRRLLAAAALVLAAALSACSGGTPTTPRSAAPTPTPSPTGTPTTAPPVAPRAGQCYQLSLRAATRPTSARPAVPCGGAHTAQTIHVGRLDTLVDGHLLAVDSDRAQRQLATTCPRELAGFLGGTAERRALSRFQVVWFSPTLAQYDAGARWFRCDVIAFGDAGHLLPLTGRRLRGVLDRPDALATYGLCGTAQPGSPGFERVACGRQHTWVAVSTIPIDGGDRYPGEQAVRDAGDSSCADRVRGANGFPLEFTYGWEWPTREQWAAGQRFGYCWAPNDLA